MRIDAAVTKCDNCGSEMNTAPLAEYWHWQSDGPGGLFVLCAECVKNWRYSTASWRGSRSSGGQAAA